MAKPHQREVDENFEAFTKLLPELIKSHPGKYAVMHNTQIIDFFDSISDAIRFGHERYGDMNFSVQEVKSHNINLGYHSYAMQPHSD